MASLPRSLPAALLALALITTSAPSLLHAADYDLVALASPRPPQDLGASGPLTLTYQVQEIFTGDPSSLTVVVTHEGLNRSQRERLDREDRVILLAHADPKVPGRFAGPMPLRATSSAIASFRSWSAPADVRPPKPVDDVIAQSRGAESHLTDGAVIEHVSADPPAPVVTPTPVAVPVPAPTPTPVAPEPVTTPVVVQQHAPAPIIPAPPVAPAPTPVSSPVVVSSPHAPATSTPVPPPASSGGWGGMVIIDTVRVGGGQGAPAPQSMATPQFIVKDGQFQRLPSDVAPGTFGQDGRPVARPTSPTTPQATPWQPPTGAQPTAVPVRGAAPVRPPLMNDPRLQPTSKAPGLPPAPPAGKVLGTPISERTDLQRATGDDD